MSYLWVWQHMSYLCLLTWVFSLSVDMLSLCLLTYELSLCLLTYELSLSVDIQVISLSVDIWVISVCWHMSYLSVCWHMSCLCLLIYKLSLCLLTWVVSVTTQLGSFCDNIQVTFVYLSVTTHKLSLWQNKSYLYHIIQVFFSLCDYFVFVYSYDKILNIIHNNLYLNI